MFTSSFCIKVPRGKQFLVLVVQWCHGWYLWNSFDFLLTHSCQMVIRTPDIPSTPCSGRKRRWKSATRLICPCVRETETFPWKNSKKALLLSHSYHLCLLVIFSYNWDGQTAGRKKRFNHCHIWVRDHSHFLFLDCKVETLSRLIKSPPMPESSSFWQCTKLCKIH